jgi:hypothetical protein
MGAGGLDLLVQFSVCCLENDLEMMENDLEMICWCSFLCAVWKMI